MKTRFYVVFACAVTVLITVGVVQTYFPALAKSRYFVAGFLILIPIFFTTDSILDWKNGEIVLEETNRGRTVISKKDNPVTFYFKVLYPIIFSLVAFTIIIGGLVQNNEPNKSLVPTPASVTPAADAPVAPDAGAAHL